MKLLDAKLSEDGCSSELLSVIKTVLAGCKKVSNILSSGDFSYILLGSFGVQQDNEKEPLNTISNNILKDLLVDLCVVKAVASKEDEQILSINEEGKFLVSFDPLDGYSNVEVNGPVGTIFSITSSTDWLSSFNEQQFNKPGELIRAAGFVLYGPATSLVLTTGTGTHIYTFSREFGDFVLWRENIAIPKDSRAFSVNLARQRYWPENVKKYVKHFTDGRYGVGRKDYSLRYVGSFVGEVYRILCRGGVFLYPQEGTRRQYLGNGKLKLLYKVMPMAFIAERANGLAYADQMRVLDIVPNSVKQRAPLIIGSKNEVERYFKNEKQGKSNAQE